MHYRLNRLQFPSEVLAQTSNIKVAPNKSSKSVNIGGSEKQNSDILNIQFLPRFSQFIDHIRDKATPGLEPLKRKVITEDLEVIKRAWGTYEPVLKSVTSISKVKKYPPKRRQSYDQTLKMKRDWILDIRNEGVAYGELPIHYTGSGNTVNRQLASLIHDCYRAYKNYWEE